MSLLQGRSSWRAPSRRSWAKLVLAVAAVGLAAYVLAGSGQQLQQAADTLAGVRPQWVVLGAGAEVASYVCIGVGLRALLGGRPGIVVASTIGVTAQAAANCLPGGAAVSAVVTYRQLRRWGSPSVAATSAVVLLGVLQTAALPLLTLAGSQLASGSEPIPGLRLLSTVVLGVLVAVAVALVALRRHRLPSRTLAAGLALADRVRARVPGLRRGVRPGAPVGLAGLQELSTEPAVLAVAAGVALAYWLFDALCLAASFPAVGAGVPWAGLLVSYSAAQLASVLPFTPGGLGVVEGSLTVGLVAYGGATTTTLSAVLLYRLISFWGLLPAGAVGWLALRKRPGAQRPGTQRPGTQRSGTQRSATQRSAP